MERDRFYLTCRESEREGIRSKSWALKAEALRRKDHDANREERKRGGGEGRGRSVCEKRERESGGGSLRAV